MRVNKKEAKLLDDAITQWHRENMIDDYKATELRKSISPYKTEFDSIAFYASIAAVSCALLAFGALVMDEKWIERLRAFFAFSEFAIGIIFGSIALLLIWIAKKRKKKYAYARLANESFHILITLNIGVSVAYIAKGFHVSINYYGLIILLIAMLYGVCGIYLQSKLLWGCMLLGIISAWGAQTYTLSTDAGKSYFMGMNYPLRMTLLGAVMIALTYLLKNNKSFQPFYNITKYASWIFFLVSALFLSVSGNLNYELWSAIKQGKLFIWSLAFTLLLIVCIVYALKIKDELLRDILILFFLLNLYTRYFEYFWDGTNKGIFFTIMALSFWLIAKKAEQVRQRLV